MPAWSGHLGVSDRPNGLDTLQTCGWLETEQRGGLGCPLTHSVRVKPPASSPTHSRPTGLNLTSGGLSFTEKHSGCSEGDRRDPGHWPPATARPTPAHDRLQRDLSRGTSCNRTGRPRARVSPVPEHVSTQTLDALGPQARPPAHLRSVLGQRPQA